MVSIFFPGQSIKNSMNIWHMRVSFIKKKHFTFYVPIIHCLVIEMCAKYWNSQETRDSSKSNCSNNNFPQRCDECDGIAVVFAIVICSMWDIATNGNVRNVIVEHNSIGYSCFIATTFSLYISFNSIFERCSKLLSCRNRFFSRSFAIFCTSLWCGIRMTLNESYGFLNWPTIIIHSKSLEIGHIKRWLIFFLQWFHVPNRSEIKKSFKRERER